MNIDVKVNQLHFVSKYSRIQEGSEELVSKIGELMIKFDREKITAITNQEDHINERCMATV